MSQKRPCEANPKPSRAWRNSIPRRFAQQLRRAAGRHSMPCVVDRWGNSSAHCASRYALIGSVALPLLAILHTSTVLAAASTGFGDRTILRAAEAYEQGDDAMAIALLEPLLNHPGTGEIWDEARFVAARSALNLGRHQQALDFLQNLEELLPEVADFVLQMRAQAERGLGHWQSALEIWKFILTHHTDSPLLDDARYGIADAAFALGLYSQAQHDYESAIRRSPRSDGAVVARFNIARIREFQGQWADACKRYRYVADRYPSHPLQDDANQRAEYLVNVALAAPLSLRQRLGRVDRLLSAHSVEEAEQTLSEIAPLARSATDQRYLQYRYAKLAFRQRDFRQAEMLFKQLIDMTRGGEQREYSGWLARTYSAAGDNNRAIDVYLSLANSDNGRSSGAKESLFRAAWHAYHGGDFNRALRLFGQFVERYPHESTSAEVLWYIGWNAYHLGDLPAAAASLQQLQQRFPSSDLLQRALYWQGRIAARMGAIELAKAHYNEAVQVAPLTYYGAYARQRLSQLFQDSQTPAGPPVAMYNDRADRSLTTNASAWLPSNLPANIEASQPLLASGVPRGFYPTREELPESAPLTPLTSEHLPWGSSVFDWDTKEGRRAIRLIRLRLNDPASQVIQRMRPMLGHGREDVDYARARLLYSLGDFNRAYRIVGRTFDEQLDGLPQGRERRYFQMAYPSAYREVVSA
ncbi:MAG: tetratricopeptide repeat protein [Myxococcota bacterium]